MRSKAAISAQPKHRIADIMVLLGYALACLCFQAVFPRDILGFRSPEPIEVMPWHHPRRGGKRTNSQGTGAREGREGLGLLGSEAPVGSILLWPGWSGLAGCRKKLRPSLAPMGKKGHLPPAWLGGQAGNQAAAGRGAVLCPFHLQHCSSASPSSVAVLLDQVLGHTLRIHPPVLRSQVLAGHRQKTRTFPGRALCAGTSLSGSCRAEGGGREGRRGEGSPCGQVGLLAMPWFFCSINPHLARRSTSWAGWCSCPMTPSTRTSSS